MCFHSLLNHNLCPPRLLFFYDAFSVLISLTLSDFLHYSPVYPPQYFPLSSYFPPYLSSFLFLPICSYTSSLLSSSASFLGLFPSSASLLAHFLTLLASFLCLLLSSLFPSTPVLFQLNPWLPACGILGSGGRSDYGVYCGKSK